MKKFIQITFLLFFYGTSNLIAQLEFNVEASKVAYTDNEYLVLDFYLKNITDTTVKVLFSNQSSCQYSFTLDDYNSDMWKTCLPMSEEVFIPPKCARQYQLLLKGDYYGLPKTDGEHKLKVLTYFQYQPYFTSPRIVLEDSVIFVAEKLLGGRLSVGFDYKNDSLVTLLKDSINVEVVNRSYLSALKTYQETWQFYDVSIDSLFENLNNDERLNYVDIDRFLPMPTTTLITSVNEENDHQEISSFKLSQNYPNPFNPTTTIKYSIPFVEMGHAPSLRTSLIVYDVLGNEIKELVNEDKSSGEYSVAFDAGNLASGIYYYRLRSGKYSETKKMVYIK